MIYTLFIVDFKKMSKGSSLDRRVLSEISNLGCTYTCNACSGMWNCIKFYTYTCVCVCERVVYVCVFCSVQMAKTD